MSEPKLQRRPIIAVTPDYGFTKARPGRPSLPRYELKRSYADAVLAAGGLPLVVPYCAGDGAAEQAMRSCDALLVTGGGFDVPPAFYGAAPHPQLGPLLPERSLHERALIRAALAADKPVLGVCGGMQLLAVEAGATLWQDLPSERPSEVAHEQANDPSAGSHAVHLRPGSLLQRALGVDRLPVNSTHHQAVREPGRCAVVAEAPDGLIEAIELPGRFAVGVQWHPELLAGPEHLAVYRALVRAAA